MLSRYVAPVPGSLLGKSKALMTSIRSAGFMPGTYQAVYNGTKALPPRPTFSTPPAGEDFALPSAMTGNFWCSACNKAMAVGTSRGAAMLVAPLIGIAVGALPKLFRRRFGLGGFAVQTALGIGAGYLANRYLTPLVQRQVCGECGAAA